MDALASRHPPHTATAWLMACAYPSPRVRKRPPRRYQDQQKPEKQGTSEASPSPSLGAIAASDRGDASRPSREQVEPPFLVLGAILRRRRVMKRVPPCARERDASRCCPAQAHRAQLLARRSGEYRVEAGDPALRTCTGTGAEAGAAPEAAPTLCAPVESAARRRIDGSHRGKLDSKGPRRSTPRALPMSPRQCGCAMAIADALTRSISRCLGSTSWATPAKPTGSTLLWAFSKVKVRSSVVLEEQRPSSRPNNNPKIRRASGLSMPWYWYQGNHDELDRGNIGINPAFRSLAR